MQLAQVQFLVPHFPGTTVEKIPKHQTLSTQALSTVVRCDSEIANKKNKQKKQINFRLQSIFTDSFLSTISIKVINISFIFYFKGSILIFRLLLYYPPSPQPAHKQFIYLQKFLLLRKMSKLLLFYFGAMPNNAQGLCLTALRSHSRRTWGAIYLFKELKESSCHQRVSLPFDVFHEEVYFKLVIKVTINISPRSSVLAAGLGNIQ